MKRRIESRGWSWSIVLLVVLVSVPAFGQDQPAPAEPTLQSVHEMLKEHATNMTLGVDTMWVTIAAMLVFFMQAGFGMVEAGFIRAKNTCNILTKNFLAVFAAIKATIGLRVSKQEEMRGLDIGEHGMESYAGFQIFVTE